MYFVASELREIMAKLGFRTIDEMIGKSQFQQMNNLPSNHLNNH